LEAVEAFPVTPPGAVIVPVKVEVPVTDKLPPTEKPPEDFVAVTVIFKSLLPSIDPFPAISPLKVRVRGVSHLEAVAELPTKSPLKVVAFTLLFTVSIVKMGVIPSALVI
jgi:hypothetical protein